MKNRIRALLQSAAERAHAAGLLPSDAFPDIEIETPRLDAHGDFATNLAMVMAKTQKMAPRRIAEALVGQLTAAEGLIAKAEIAGPGFINLFLPPSAWTPLLTAIHEADARFGACDMGGGAKIQVEFVSSNPTGPLHVGHGRGAAVGDSLARILAFCGYDVQREYYVNDSGRQIQTLGLSVFLRYQALFGRTVDFPAECYQGDYIIDLARELKLRHGEDLLAIAPAEALMTCARFAAGTITEGMRQDLLDFGVAFDRWFSEQSLYDGGEVEKAIQFFRARGQIYEHDGAQWFRTSAFGDEKDRVVVRQNGMTTYFASDIAYHLEKFSRGFARVIDVWGADHHGYIPRMKAAIAAGGRNPECLQIVLVQLVNLLRGGTPVAMSTRAGEFVTLREVFQEVGRDAARFLFLTRTSDSPLDFDLELAKQKSNDNPVYYVQYVHARIASIRRKAAEGGLGESGAPAALAALNTPEDVALIKHLAQFPEAVAAAANSMEPHRVTFYLMNLAGAFHSYYNKQRVLTDDLHASQGRLYLIAAVQKVIRNGLDLLGVSAPERM